ncbi:hypothetical protein [Streptomyces sp. NPDC056938]|uniref:hypothetical protein n=1 Tax=unclassified Streptomyces TaxID=2593676 RepID=UPI0036426EB3
MTALRVFASLTGQLQVLPAAGLVEHVRTVCCVHGSNERRPRGCAPSRGTPLGVLPEWWGSICSPAAHL